MKLLVLSKRNIDRSPATCCMVELEDILVREYGTELYCLPHVPQNVSGATVFCILLAFYELKLVESELARLKRAGNRVILYLFDCWDGPSILSARRRRLRNRLRPSLRLDQVVDRLCLPFRAVCDMLQPQYRALARHVPFGVDTTLANGLNSERPISILAYGKQPPEPTRTFAEGMNRPDSPEIFHHTDHMSIAHIDDQRLHRMHFWKLAQSAQIALAYDARLTSPHRVPISIVGQRFFESLAAGCVVVGKRPSTNEADELLDWPEAILDLPDDPADALETVRALLANRRHLAEIRERNVEHVRAGHDWRNRIPSMFS